MDCSYSQIWVASPQDQKKDREKLMVPIRVNGTLTLALVDTGCSQTLIQAGVVPNPKPIGKEI